MELRKVPDFIDMLKISLLLAILFVIHFDVPGQSIKDGKKDEKIAKSLKEWSNPIIIKGYSGKIKIDSVWSSARDKEIKVYFSKSLAYAPVRDGDAELLKKSITNKLKKKYKNYSIHLFTDGHVVQDLVPNLFRKSMLVDTNRIQHRNTNLFPLITRGDSLFFRSGLMNCNIAVWPSHGYYYEAKQDRWRWQRAPLFGTVEDISTLSYIYQFLEPMLENAGATVFIPRERDDQINEVIVDNDRSTGKSELLLQSDCEFKEVTPGFIFRDTLFGNDNPFQKGTSIHLDGARNKGKVCKLIADLPVSGEYAVYISYLRNKANSPKVKYTVNYSGGKRIYYINQQIGGSTWLYLGKFLFKAGKDITNGSVYIEAIENGLISIDGIKFGGGMGNIARRPGKKIMSRVKSSESNLNKEKDAPEINPDDFQWKISGKPRFTEGARYYLQYAGMPDTMVYNLNNGMNDYNDDYQSRGAWVNYLSGNAKSTTTGELFGLNIPIDLSLAFHTDAGTTPNDSVIGTLGIYSTSCSNGLLPDGKSKILSRDFTDVVMTQVIDDIRNLYNPGWSRRGLWDKAYSEACRPLVPAMLLELLSHQNYNDIKYGLDPGFRFSVARAIYKGMLRFQAFQEGRGYVVQPLPVENFLVTIVKNKKIQLAWKPVLDSLEPTARPTLYKVYKRSADNGFDNGVFVKDTFLNIELECYNQIYSFRITALNEGGESFPSEILSVGIKEGNVPVVLIVNAFDRVCGPGRFEGGNQLGNAWWKDEGVPYIKEISYCGKQYEFDRKVEWVDDDYPGWGACNTDMAGKVFAGNTFDYPYIHGEAILKAGHSFTSVSRKAFCSKKFDIHPYQFTDIILGKQKTNTDLYNAGIKKFQIYTPDFINKLKEIVNSGKPLFMSGSYIGYDLGQTNDSSVIKFAKNELHFYFRTSLASAGNQFYSTDYSKKWFQIKGNFNTDYSQNIYRVESPDGIEPYGPQAFTAFRYFDNNKSAGVYYNGNFRAIYLGFPFETITSNETREKFMLQIVNYLTK